MKRIYCDRTLPGVFAGACRFAPWRMADHHIGLTAGERLRMHARCPPQSAEPRAGMPAESGRVIRCLQRSWLWPTSPSAQGVCIPRRAGRSDCAPVVELNRTGGCTSIGSGLPRLLSRLHTFVFRGPLSCPKSMRDAAFRHRRSDEGFSSHSSRLGIRRPCG